MEILMKLKGVVWGICDVLVLMGFFGLLKTIVFSTVLLAQAGGAAEAVQHEQSEQGTRITRLEDRQNATEMIRNFEYGGLLLMGGFVTWFLKETAKNTNKIAVLGTQHGHLGEAVVRIEKKLDSLVGHGVRGREA